MNWIRQVSKMCVCALIVLSESGQIAAAQTLELDGFDEPSPAVSITAFGELGGGTDVATLRTSAPSIRGGAREVFLNYGDGTEEVARADTGFGTLSMQQPSATTGYVTLRYGAFMPPPGEGELRSICASTTVSLSAFPASMAI